MIKSLISPKALLLALCAVGAMSGGTLTVTAINPLPPLSSYITDGLGNPVGPYQLTTSTGNLTVTCLDVALESGPGTMPYQAYQTTAFQAANTVETQTYTAGKTTVYEQEAYLFSLLLAASNQTTQKEIQDAIWAVTNSSFLATLNSHNVSGNSDYTQAHGALVYYNLVTGMSQANLESTVNQNNYTILSEVPGSGPTNSGQNQEFIYFNNGTTSAPEPATVGMLGLSLVAFGLFGKRFVKNGK